MTISPDNFLGPWLDRLQVPRGAPPTLGTLRRITQRHQDCFPFENIDVFCGGIPSLQLPDLIEKLIGNVRGGYCFELAALLQAGLEAVGFDARPLMARVIWGRDQPGPRTHAFLLVEAEERSWLVDVGFGGPGPIEPVEMNLSADPAVAGQATYRLEDQTDLGIVLSMQSSPVRWAPLYAFDLERIGPDDLAEGNRLAATAPGTIFRRGLKVSRQRPGMRVTLNGFDFKRYAEGGLLETTTFAGPSQVIASLAADFGIRLDAPLERALVARLERDKAR